MPTQAEIISRSAEVLHGNILTAIAFEDHVRQLGWTIGALSYGVPNIINYLSHRVPHLEIGSYCSIAAEVEIMFGGAHHIDFITSYPIGFAKPFVGEEIRQDLLDDAHAEVRIGHDVWLGRGAKIFGGVTIGTGAVVGAYAVVAKDVEPYAIVAGNPARKIRSRFDEAEIAMLLESRWWELPVDDIERLQGLLLSRDVAGLSQAVAGLRKRAA